MISWISIIAIVVVSFRSGSWAVTIASPPDCANPDSASAGFRFVPGQGASAFQILLKDPTAPKDWRPPCVEMGLFVGVLEGGNPLPPLRMGFFSRIRFIDFAVRHRRPQPEFRPT